MIIGACPITDFLSIVICSLSKVKSNLYDRTFRSFPTLSLGQAPEICRGGHSWWQLWVRLRSASA